MLPISSITQLLPLGIAAGTAATEVLGSFAELLQAASQKVSGGAAHNFEESADAEPFPLPGAGLHGINRAAIGSATIQQRLTALLEKINGRIRELLTEQGNAPTNIEPVSLNPSGELQVNEKHPQASTVQNLITKNSLFPELHG